MAWTTKVSDNAKKQLGKLDRQIADRITRYLDEHVLTLPDPRMSGEALTGDFQGYWKYRVGSYRIVCALQNDELVVLMVRIGHRKEVYH